MEITLDVDPEDLQFAEVREALENRAPMHAHMADKVEEFVKKFGRVKARSEHRTAGRLGAKPTGHLSQAYQGIQSRADASGASLLVPRASRLRAAFGKYTITPQSSKYLTIAVNAEVYGRRAWEFDDLEFLRVGPKKTPILARDKGEDQLETMYLLVESAEIPEDSSLLPFDELPEAASLAAKEYLDAQIIKALNKS
ncbi:MAG: hypothetical protein ACQKBY_11245 [Verrucomicrobiales bacterium]